MAVELEQLLDKIADELILDENGVVTPEVVRSNQKTINSGQLSLGRDSGNRLILYQKDVEANKNDLYIYDPDGEPMEVLQLQILADMVNDINAVQVSIMESQVGTYDITIGGGGITPNTPLSFIINPENNNPLNVSQFLPIEQKRTVVDVDRANEYLDTTIYELLPTGDTRQARIIRFFEELNALLPPIIPTFDDNNDGRVDRDASMNWSGDTEYQQDNSISYAQENPDESTIDEEDAFIHRLKNTANETFNSRTIEDIYNTIEPYLLDLLEDATPPIDERPIYRNQSTGYLKFRNLNQGIIVRNTNQDFVEGLNPITQDYLTTGFTITMWVRFLDKTSTGTLFNFGNPMRIENPFGIRLETFVGNQTNSRHIRLIVMENNFGDGYPTQALRDSHIGVPNNDRVDTSYLIDTPEDTFWQTGFIPNVHHSQYTSVPYDFQEWYFICANYKPNLREDESIIQATNLNYLQNSDYWRGNLFIDELGTGEVLPTSYSNYGAKCKVEIISRSDLLRARGFKA